MFRSMFRSVIAASSVAALLILGGCGEGGSTGVTCPTGGSQLTYQNFGKSFMDQYCTRCHGSTLTGSARQGAPGNVNVDTLAGVVASSGEIDRTSGSGRSEMPPNGTKPTSAERQQLSEWLACGAPQ